MNLDPLWALLGIGFTGTVTLITSQVTARSQERVKAKETRGPDWQALVDEMQEWTEQRLAERDDRIDDLRSDVDRLERAVREVKQKYKAALDHIRGWREVHGSESGPVVPDLIQGDL